MVYGCRKKNLFQGSIFYSSLISISSTFIQSEFFLNKKMCGSPLLISSGEIYFFNKKWKYILCTSMYVCTINEKLFLISYNFSSNFLHTFVQLEYKNC